MTGLEKIANVACGCGDGSVANPYPYEHTESACEACQGTGKRFWWLWQECNVNTSIGHMEAQRQGHLCPHCYGKGYVLITENVTDALLRVASESERDIEVTFYPDGNVEAVYIGGGHGYRRTPRLPLTAALVEALGIEKP